MELWRDNFVGGWAGGDNWSVEVKNVGIFVHNKLWI